MSVISDDLEFQSMQEANSVMGQSPARLSARAQKAKAKKYRSKVGEQQ